MAKMAVIRIRGTANLKEPIERTFKQLRLLKPNHMIIVDDYDKYKGMILKVKDFVTWGELDDSLLDKLKERYDNNKHIYRLHPPKKGHGKGIKLSYKVGGALGYRGKDINDLIKRML